MSALQVSVVSIQAAAATTTIAPFHEQTRDDDETGISPKETNEIFTEDKTLPSKHDSPPFPPERRPVEEDEDEEAKTQSNTRYSSETKEAHFYSSWEQQQQQQQQHSLPGEYSQWDDSSSSSSQRRQLWSEQLREHCISRRTQEEELLYFFEQATISHDSSLDPPRTAAPTTSQQYNFLLVSGPSGSDKSNFAKIVLGPTLEAKGGYLITGKFDSIALGGDAEPTRRPLPYEAFLQTFNELTHLIARDGEEALGHWYNVLRSHLNPSELRVLSDRIPSLEHVLRLEGSLSEIPLDLLLEQQQGESSPAKRAEGASKKFIFAFRKFVRAMGSIGYPVVMQLDDLQESDWCSVDVLSDLVQDARNAPGLVIIGTCPNDCSKPQEAEAVSEEESRGNTYLMSKRAEIDEACGGTIPTVTLQYLATADVVNFVNDAFSLGEQEGEQLAAMMMAQTGGNYVYFLEFLEWLCTSGHLRIVHDTTDPTWVWDGVCNTAVSDLSLSHNKFLQFKLRRLAKQEIEVLKVASCLGFSFYCLHAEYVLGFPVGHVVNNLVQQGMLVPDPTRRDLYCFQHEDLQQAAYDLIAESEKELFHLEVGRRLWRKLDQEAVDCHLFLFLSQMHQGRRLIHREKEKVAIATLCLHAGQQAARISSFRIALVYLNFGIEMLPQRSWRDEYELSLALYTSAAEMDYCVLNFDRVERKVAEISENVRGYNDSVQAYATKMLTLSAQNNFCGCVKLGMEVLKNLGVSYPRRTIKIFLLREIMSIERILRSKSDEQILRMPLMTDESQFRILHILCLLFFPAMGAMQQDLCAFIIVKCMRITLRFGLSPMASFAFANYGFVRVNMGQMKAGPRYSKLGLKLLDHFQALELLPRVYCLYYGMIHSWVGASKESLKPLLYARDVAMQTGDIEFAAMSGHSYGWISMECGLPLEAIVNEWTKFGEILRRNNQLTLLHYADTSLQFAHHVMGRTDDPLCGKGELVDFDEVHEKALEKNNKWDIYDISSTRMKLGLLFGDIELAEKNCISPKELLNIPPGYERISCALIIGLVSVECARRGRNPHRNIRNVARMVKHLRKWADISPRNFSDRAFLLEAELASFRGNNDLAYKSYLYGSAMAKESGNFFLTGLINELFAKHLVKLGNLEAAKPLFDEALEAYERWQGFAKVRFLKDTIKKIFG